MGQEGGAHPVCDLPLHSHQPLHVEHPDLQPAHRLVSHGSPYTDAEVLWVSRCQRFCCAAIKARPATQRTSGLSRKLPLMLPILTSRCGTPFLHSGAKI